MHGRHAICALLFCTGAAADNTTQARPFAERMISVDTSAPQGHELPLVQEIAKHLTASGIHATAHPSGPARANLVARLAADRALDPPLILHASLDVAPCALRRWSSGSSSLREKDGVLTGCGIAEGKGAAAMMVAALLDLHQSGLPLRRDVLLILTSDGLGSGAAGISHLWKVLPDLPEHATVITPGSWSDANDDGSARFLGAQRNPAETMTITLKAHGDAVGPGQISPSSSASRLLRAVGRVEAHQFPARATPPVKSGDGGVLFPPLDALVRTSCRVSDVQLGPLPGVATGLSSATVTCHLVPPDEPSQIAWFMVDVVKDPRVVVERAKNPPPVDAAAPADVVAALQAAAGSAFKAPVIWLRGPASPEASRMRAHGWDVVEVGMVPLTRAQWGAAHGADASVHVRAFSEATAFTSSLLRQLAVAR